MIDPRTRDEGECPTWADAEPGQCEHLGWHHAEGFEEIVLSLSRDLDVHDFQGDLVVACTPDRDGQWRIAYRLSGVVDDRTRHERRGYADLDREYLTMDPDPFLVQDHLYENEGEFEAMFDKIARNHRNTHEAR